MKLIINTDPLNFSIPQKGLRREVFNLVNGAYFKVTIYLSLLFDVVVLISFFEEEPIKMQNFSSYFRYFIWCFYFIEMVFKIFSYGFCAYLSENHHKIELLIVLCNFFDIVFSNIVIKYITTDDYFRLRLLKVMNLFELTIFLRIIRYMKSIENLYNTLRFAFMMLFHLFLTIFMTIFIYSIIGCLYFNSVIKGKIVDDNINFKNVFNGMLTMFKCVTCDNWADIMMDFSKTPPFCQDGVDCGSRKIIN